jgi:hypothetical protein
VLGPDNPPRMSLLRRAAGITLTALGLGVRHEQAASIRVTPVSRASVSPTVRPETMSSSADLILGGAACP